MQIRLLDGIAASSDDGEPIDIGPAKCQALLASLALSVGTAVPVYRLVELIWGDDPPRTAEKTLQTYVTRLRQALGAGSIERSGAAYRLALDPAAVDVTRFQRHLAAGDVATALQEWTGTPLAGLDAPGLAGTVDALVEQWLGALEADVEQLVDRDPGAAVAALTELVAQHPFREGLWALLMTALYREGRQADALAAYGRARNVLVEELGVEPGHRLRELESLILGQDARLDTGSGAAVPAGTVTFAFTDIEGSSRLWADHRRAMADAVARHDEIVRSATADRRGYIFSTGGDGFGVAFHRAGDAAEWAMALQVALTAEPWPPGVEVRVRIGLHTGEAEERGNDYFGPPVNIAARLAAAGHGGQILASALTATLFDGRETRELGYFDLADIDTEIAVVQLDGGDHPPPRTEKARRGNLPRPSSRLLGREAALETVVEAIAVHPVVTLVGPGGIGKTRLAVEAARMAEADSVDGVWMVELADIAASAEVDRAVADALDVIELPDRPLTRAIVDRLAPRQAVLLLDNCEHVVEGVADLARAIAAGCRAVTVLATSREGLGIADEQLVVVTPLETAGPAVELFAERARAADPEFQLERERSEIEEICRRLDGVPLAIELAAARVRTMAPGDLLARLDDRLRLLTGGRRRAVERHRTLRATIQWSYDLLTPPEQLLFRRLSVFAGTFGLEAAAAVAADEELTETDIDQVLGDLVERSMVSVQSGVRGRQFRLLETMRQFGAEHLFEAGDSERIASRHADHVRKELVRVGELLYSNQEIEGAIRLGELWPNVRAAVDWALDVEDRELASALIAPIALQTFVRRGLGEIAEWTERLLAITPEDDEEAIATGLLWAALHYTMNGDRQRFRRLAEANGPPDHLFARYAYLVGVEDEDFSALELGPRIVAEMRDRGQLALARLFEMFTAASLLTAGRFDEARARHEALAEELRAAGPPSILSWTLYLLGIGAAFRGDHELADRYWDESSAVEVPYRTNSTSEALAARAAFRKGRIGDAYSILRSYIDELVETDNLAGASMVGLEFVTMMTTLGRLDDAGVILGHFDGTGLLDQEGHGFEQLVRVTIEAVADDPAATAAREKAAARGLDERGALAHMRAVLTDLLDDRFDSDSAAAQPSLDRTRRG